MALASRSNRSLNCAPEIFDRDIPIQTPVMGAIHFAHSAFADRRKDLLRTEFVAERKRHLTDAVKFIRSGSGLLLYHRVLFHYFARRHAVLSRRAHVAHNPRGCERFLTQREAVQVVRGGSVP